MRVSRERVAEHRRKILDAAGTLFREKGFEAVTVAEVMKAAGLTHGGFYGHFKSKDDLIAQCLAHAAPAGVADAIDPARYAKAYLCQDHLSDVAGGCLMAGLGPETLRQGPEARAAMTESLKRQLDRLSKGAPGATPAQKRRAAIGTWSAMVGAMILARISDDPALAKELMTQTQEWIAAATKKSAA